MVRDTGTPVPGPWTQAEQMAFIAETLQRIPDPRWTIVIIHQALWTTPTPRRTIGRRSKRCSASATTRCSPAIRIAM